MTDLTQSPSGSQSKNLSDPGRVKDPETARLIRQLQAECARLEKLIPKTPPRQTNITRVPVLSEKVRQNSGKISFSRKTMIFQNGQFLETSPEEGAGSFTAGSGTSTSSGGDGGTTIIEVSGTLSIYLNGTGAPGG